MIGSGILSISCSIRKTRKKIEDKYLQKRPSTGWATGDFLVKNLHEAADTEGEVVDDQERVGGTIMTPPTENGGRPRRTKMVGGVWGRPLPSSGMIQKKSCCSR